MKSFIVKIIGIVIIGSLAGVAIWYAFFRPPASQPTREENSPADIFGNAPGNETVGTTSQAQTQAQSSPAPDITSAYDALFKRLDAEQLQFTAVDASDQSGIYALYESDVAIAKEVEPKAQNFSIEVSMTDLNYDGVPEAVVYENLPGFCGAGGCNLDVYTKSDGTWHKILDTLAESDAIAFSNAFTNKFGDLYIPVYGNTIGNDTDVVRYSWDGTEYQAQGPVATWVGTAFQTVQ